MPVLERDGLAFYRVEIPTAAEDALYEFTGSWLEHRSGPGELVESLFLGKDKQAEFKMPGPTWWWSGWRITGTAPELTIDLDEFDTGTAAPIVKHYLGTVAVTGETIAKGVLSAEFASVLRRRQKLTRRLKASRRYPVGIGGHSSGRSIGG